jgi:hypothetical protein
VERPVQGDVIRNRLVPSYTLSRTRRVVRGEEAPGGGSPQPDILRDFNRSRVSVFKRFGSVRF